MLILFIVTLIIKIIFCNFNYVNEKSVISCASQDLYLVMIGGPDKSGPRAGLRPTGSMLHISVLGRVGLGRSRQVFLQNESTSFLTYFAGCCKLFFYLTVATFYVSARRL